MKAITRFAAGLAGAALIGVAAQAAEVTLTVHHFLSPKSPAHTQFMEPWAKRIEEQSKGRIKVEIFPSMSMGGKPPELYSQVRDGAADIVWTVLGYTPGVFPRAEVFELPTVHKNSALATNRAIQDSFGMIAEDFKEVHPIAVHVHRGNALHMVSKEAMDVSDLRGLKLRTPSRTGAWMIESWGAEPVGMPVPDLPQALSKGVVDGALVPFEIVAPLKLHELTAVSVEGPDHTRFGTAVFLYAMNKERYDDLPNDLKAVIDANAGPALAEEIGKVWDAVEAPGTKMQVESGGKVLILSAEAQASFDKLGEQVVRRWVDEANAKGLDGEVLVKSARDAVAKYSQ